MISSSKIRYHQLNLKNMKRQFSWSDKSNIDVQIEIKNYINYADMYGLFQPCIMSTFNRISINIFSLTKSDNYMYIIWYFFDVRVYTTDLISNVRSLNKIKPYFPYRNCMHVWYNVYTVCCLIFTWKKLLSVRHELGISCRNNIIE